jgi:hypothetical protein
MGDICTVTDLRYHLLGLAKCSGLEEHKQDPRKPEVGQLSATCLLTVTMAGECR